MSEYHNGYRCSVCGEDYWSTNETTAHIKMKRVQDGMSTTKIWEFHVCDKCLKKLVVCE